MYRYKQFLFGFLVWGRVPGWWLMSRGGGGLLCGGTPFSIFVRIYIKWSLGLKHFCAGGGGNVTLVNITVPAL